MRLTTIFLLSLALIIGIAANTAKQGYAIGDKAMSFNLPDVTGEMVSPASMADAKGFIVVFTCNHCPFSVKYEDRIIELNNAYAEKGYPVIAINPNDAKAYPSDSYEAMKERAEAKGFTFPYLHDESQEVAKAYGATKTPHTFVVEKVEEDLIVRYIGAIDDDTNGADVGETYVEAAVNALIKGKKVKTKETKAVGCSIKWKK
ncbi:MAG: thioredoxin family protein [Bacteroidia bacterium]